MRMLHLNHGNTSSWTSFIWKSMCFFYISFICGPNVIIMATITVYFLWSIHSLPGILEQLTILIPFQLLSLFLTKPDPWTQLSPLSKLFMKFSAWIWIRTWTVLFHISVVKVIIGLYLKSFVVWGLCFGELHRVHGLFCTSSSYDPLYHLLSLHNKEQKQELLVHLWRLANRWAGVLPGVACAYLISQGYIECFGFSRDWPW